MHGDMLVNLMKLPDVSDIIHSLAGEEIQIIRALPPDKALLVDWVKTHWNSSAASECECSFAYNPPRTYVAVHENKIIGFASFDSTAPNFFGPTKVDEKYRGKDIGKVLLVKCLEAMREEGFGYAIIGGVGPIRFYEKSVGAMLIPDSAPGIYHRYIGGM